MCCWPFFPFYIPPVVSNAMFFIVFPNLPPPDGPRAPGAARPPPPRHGHCRRRVDRRGSRRGGRLRRGRRPTQPFPERHKGRPRDSVLEISVAQGSVSAEFALSFLIHFPRSPRIPRPALLQGAAPRPRRCLFGPNSHRAGHAFPSPPFHRFSRFRKKVPQYFFIAAYYLEPRVFFIWEGSPLLYLRTQPPLIHVSLFYTTDHHDCYPACILTDLFRKCKPPNLGNFFIAIFF